MLCCFQSGMQQRQCSAGRYSVPRLSQCQNPHSQQPTAAGHGVSCPRTRPAVLQGFRSDVTSAKSTARSSLRSHHCTILPCLRICRMLPNVRSTPAAPEFFQRAPVP